MTLHVTHLLVWFIMAHLCFILALRGCIYAFRTSVVEPPVAKVARVATGKGGVRLSGTPPGCSGRDGKGKAKKGAKSGGKTTSSSYEPEPTSDLVVDSLEEDEGEQEQNLSEGFDEEEELKARADLNGKAGQIAGWDYALQRCS